MSCNILLSYCYDFTHIFHINVYILTKIYLTRKKKPTLMSKLFPYEEYEKLNFTKNKITNKIKITDSHPIQ